MRLYLMELKRILKTRSVLIVILGAIVLTALLAYAPISFVRYTYQDEAGNEVKVKGLEAIKLVKAEQAEYSGIITPEMIVRALAQYQECAGQYENGVYDEKMPVEEYNKKIAPVSFIVRKLAEVYADDTTGIAAETMDLTAEEAGQFYEQCSRHLVDLMNMEQPNRPQAREKATAMYEKVEKPFAYYPGTDTNAIEYFGIMVFLMAVIGVVITAPIFSVEYQTESDQILRCTRHGRRRLAAVKLLACFTILTILYAVCMTIFTVTVNSAFGWEARQTDIQFAFSAITFVEMTVGRLQMLVIGIGYLTLLATVFFTLFLSSRLKSVFASAISALIFCILPIFLSNFWGGSLAEWICAILPSGGTGMGNSFLYALLDTRFLYLGSQAFWTPCVMVAAAAVNTVLFTILTVVSYCRHRS